MDTGNRILKIGTDARSWLMSIYGAALKNKPDVDQAMNRALAEFFADPLSFDLRELVEEADMKALAQDCEAVRKELYK